MVAAGSTTRFILDGVQVVEEYDGSGAWQARYLYEDGIDQPRAMDRADIADVNGNANTTEVLRFHGGTEPVQLLTRCDRNGPAHDRRTVPTCARNTARSTT